MTQKIIVTLKRTTVADLDRLVREGRYPNRNSAVQAAVDLLREREKRTRLARELEKIDPSEEQRLAEEGLGAMWPARGESLPTGQHGSRRLYSRPVTG